MSKRRVFAAIAVAGALLLGSCSSADGAATVAVIETPTAYSALTAGDARNYVEARLGQSDFVLLDVRTAEETAAAIIEGATTGFDFYASDFADQISGLDRDAEYLVYCRSGNRSSQTLELMRQLGFTQVSHLNGGIAGWQEAGLPVVRP